MDDAEYIAGLKREIAGHDEAFKRTGCAAAEMARDMCAWELDAYLAIGEGRTVAPYPMETLCM